MGVATIQVTYWNPDVSHDEKIQKCTQTFTEIKKHVNGEISKINQIGKGDNVAYSMCEELKEYINSEKNIYKECFSDDFSNINTEIKELTDTALSKCGNVFDEFEKLHRVQEPTNLNAKAEESLTEHEDCKKETAVEGEKCETKPENGAVALEAQQLTDQGKQELNGGLPSESDPNTIPEGKFRESIAPEGGDKSQSSSSNLEGVADPKADSPAGDSGDTRTVDSRVSSEEPKDAVDPNDIHATDDLGRASSQPGGDSSLPVATTGSSTFPNFSSTVVTETSDNVISFTSDTQHIKISGNSSTGTYVEGKTTGLHPPTGEQPSDAASPSPGDLSTSGGSEMHEKSSRGEHGDSAKEGIDGSKDQERAVSGKEQFTETQSTYVQSLSDGQTVHHDQSPDAGHLGSMTQKTSLEGHTTQDTSYHGDGGKLTTEDGNSSILDYDLGGIPIKTYITIGISILGFILLLIFLIKFTVLGRFFRKKKKNNKENIQEELHRIMYSPSSLEEQNVYFSYDNSEYSQYDSQY
ncbi:PIR Superfamily Protein [Plasmodium ovale wallikeri]|uniref:PIR Superfamily Protein n=1 Tax=Plasmodium ovale wallikeri TaxID=864142 RepID=A0A1A9AL40_PLAOA|nr:PIR Superfamily Protein [Plasmodium ovale wallikeri]SBT56909.1 PIR Superfamily Protein [Plasmodium ovale wallikeri]